MEKDRLLLEVLKDEKVQRDIKELYCQLHKNSYKNGGMSGWTWDIIVDIDGKVDYMYSNCSTRMDIYEGNATVVAKIESRIEITTEDMGDVEDVADIEAFKDYLAINYSLYTQLDEEDEDYETEKAEYIEDRLNWSEYYEFNQAGYREVELAAWEAMSDEYSYDIICEKITEKIEELELQVSEMMR